jgi:hypothetical protein
MNFKKPKHIVVDEAYYAADSILVAATNSIRYNHMNQTHSSTLDQLQMAIGQAIRAALVSLAGNIYTDDEFEQDIGLRNDKI